MTTAYELQVRPGSKLGKCQKVEAVLEEGNFDFVTNCLNTETSKAVAIKVNKNHLSSAHQARLETIILKELQCLDPDAWIIMKLDGLSFGIDHICLNFEF